MRMTRFTTERSIGFIKQAAADMTVSKLTRRDSLDVDRRAAARRQCDH